MCKKSYLFTTTTLGTLNLRLVGCHCKEEAFVIYVEGNCGNQKGGSCRQVVFSSALTVLQKCGANMKMLKKTAYKYSNEFNTQESAKKRHNIP